MKQSVQYWVMASLLCAAFAVQSAVYKRVDEKGNIYFSDQPEEGYEEVEVRETTTIKMPVTAPPPRKAASRDKKSEQKSAVTSRLVITQPSQNQIVWTNTGQVSVTFSSSNTHHGGSYFVVLDGVTLQTSATSVTFDNVGVGEHSVQVMLKVNGRVVSQSDVVKFSTFRMGGRK